MTLAVTHPKVLPGPDDDDPNTVSPTDWNANHTLTGTADATQLNSSVVQAVSNDTNVTGSIATQTLTLGWTGTLASGRLNANVVQGVTNDTNVTGSIATQNLTLGWAGTLAAARLNGNVVQGVTNDTNITGSIAAQNLTLGWTGTLAAARLNANVVQGVTNDTNVTGSIAAQNLTLGWTGTLGVSRGGTGANLSATGGASQVLKQVSAGAAVTVGQLAFTDISGSVAASQMPALTGDVTTSAGAVATTVAKIQGTTVSGTTGSGAAVLATSPTLVTPVLGTATATKITAANGVSNGFAVTAAAGTNGALAMGAGGSLLFTLGSTVDQFAVNDHSGNTLFFVQETTPGTSSTTQTTFTGQVFGPDLSTTASAANAFINTGSSPAGQLLRSTSSLVYKRDVEPLDPTIALKVLSAAQPIWYRSKCAGDNAAWSWYGLGAEDMAAVEPRLVHYGFQDDDYEDVEVPDPHRGEPFTRIERRLKKGAAVKPDGVQYERLVPILIIGWQKQQARIAELEKRLALLEGPKAKN